MREESGNLFDYTADAIVIPINWRVNRRGQAIMGAGVAFQAARRWPSLSWRLGVDIEKTDTPRLFIERQYRREGTGPDILCLPTKYDWRNLADIGLIEAGVKLLPSIAALYGWETVALPRLGCGERTGQLSWDVQVRPLLADLLGDEFVVVNR